MNKTTLFRSLVFFLFVGLFACSSEEAQQKTESEQRQEELEKSLEKVGEELGNIGENVSESVNENFSEAMSKLGESLEGLSKNKDGEKVEPISHRELKKFMPDKFGSIERTDYEGQTSGALGVKISTSEATYKDGDKRVELKIIDTGGLGLALMGTAVWANMEVDKESSNGYERTTEIDGNKAYEKYDAKRQEGELAMIVKDRFVVNCNFRNMDMKDAKRAIKRMDLDDLGE